MKMSHIQPYVFGIAAALIAVPMYASMQAQPQHLGLVSANAELMQGLNSKSSRQGQGVSARLTSNVKINDRMELSKGTMLMGKVEAVRAGQSNGNGSMVSIVFNEAQLKDGREIPIKATLIAAYPPIVYGVTQNAFDYIVPQPRHISSEEKVIQDPGTLGHITMKSAVQSNVSATFFSKKKDISLRRGTRFQLAIAPETRSSSTASRS